MILIIFIYLKYKNFIKIRNIMNNIESIHHHHPYSPSTATGCLISALVYSACFLASSSSFLAYSCWVLIDSRSLAMNKSTIWSHSLSLESWPLRIITSLARSQKTIAIDFAYLFPQGMTTSTKSSGESVLHKAMVGMLTYEASITACLSDFGSATIKILGYWNFLVIWLVKVPGIHLAEALAVHPVYCPNL